ncbi:hypothetical protein [Novipirellula caenicola]|uniref:hypothetical protein n=1 Tax=Novipirellula caenicola TaxID=1536901 RepID=UPI0031E67537
MALQTAVAAIAAAVSVCSAISSVMTNDSRRIDNVESANQYNEKSLSALCSELDQLRWKLATLEHRIDPAIPPRHPGRFGNRHQD